MKPKKAKNVSTYLTKWLTTWVGLFALGLLSVIAATIVLGNVYEKGILKTEMQTAWTTDMLALRIKSVELQLVNIHHQAQTLSDTKQLNQEALEEILRQAGNASGMSTKARIIWKTNEGELLEISVPDANGDGDMDLHLAIIRTSKKEALWVSDGYWELSAPAKDVEQYWFSMSKPIKTANAYTGAVTLYVDYTDMRNQYAGVSMDKPFGWLMMSKHDGRILGDVKDMTNKSLIEVAEYLKHKVPVLAAQKGYTHLRSQFFAFPVYVFHSEPMPGWSFYKMISPEMMFEDQLMILFFMFISLLLFLLVSLLTGLRFTKRMTKGLIRLTSNITDSKTNVPLQLPEDEESYEIITLTQAFNQALTSLETQNQKLAEESERNRQLTLDISRFYAHIRLLNENNLKIDLFDYLSVAKLFQFSTGLATLFGSGSQIHREVSQKRFFDDFDIEPGIPQFDRIIEDVVSGDDTSEIELQATGRGGETIWLKCWLKKGWEIGSISGALMDISEEVRNRLADKKRLMIDSVTGLYNRNAFEEIGQKAIDKMHSGSAVYFAYITLSEYNIFQEKHGMVAGNLYIQTFARNFQSLLDPVDYAFRWIGAHFLVILVDVTSMEHFKDKSSQMIQSAATHFIDIGGVLTTFPLHVGFSVAGVHGETASELLEAAAFAEHEVTLKKMPSPNIYDPARYLMMRRETLRKGQIPEIIAQNQLYTVFQPIVSLKDGELYGYTALTRTTSEEYPAILELIEDAEEAGYSMQLEKQMVENAIMAFGTRGEANRDAHLFIKTAPYATLALDDYERFRERFFKQMSVVFEVVETRQMDPADIVLRKEIVHATGAKFALDDFGAGYSNYIALLALEPDIMKIDRELIRDIDVTPIKQQLLEDLIRYARLSGTKVLAEGVETHEELRILCHHGVDFAQGFLLGRPGEGFAQVSRDALYIIHQATKHRSIATEGHHIENERL